MQLLLSRARPDVGPPRPPPSFAAAGFEPLEGPFARGLRALSHGPGDATLFARLSVSLRIGPVPVHWEIAREPRFVAKERYGLVLAQPQTDFEVRVALLGLEPGRSYWLRCWAGGHWSPSLHLHSLSHQAVRPSSVFARRLHRNAS